MMSPKKSMFKKPELTEEVKPKKQSPEKVL